MGLVRGAWLIMRKDLRVETRSRELIYTTIFFAAACVLVFAFAFVRDAEPVEGAASGILWVTIAFSGTLALGRGFERERQAETLRALLLAPVERASVYLGKLLALILLMVLIQLVLVPLVGVLFNAPVLRSPLLLAGLLLAGTIGFGAVGTFFAAMLVRAQSRDVLLPVLLYPFAVPVLVGGVFGTAALFDSQPNPDLARLMFGMLVFFDAVFVTLALWMFEPVMKE